MNKIVVLWMALASVPTLLPGEASAEPIRLKTPATCTTAAGSTLTLPPGVYLPNDLWAKLELETKRLQEIETRLTAENDSLKGNGSLSGTLYGLAAGIIIGLTVFQ